MFMHPYAAARIAAQRQTELRAEALSRRYKRLSPPVRLDRPARPKPVTLSMWPTELPKGAESAN